MAERSKAWVCGRFFVGITGSNPTGGMDVSLSLVLSGRGSCIGQTTRPEESYRVWCVSECDREVLMMRRPWPTRGLLRHGGRDRGRIVTRGCII